MIGIRCARSLGFAESHTCSGITDNDENKVSYELGVRFDLGRKSFSRKCVI